MPVAGDDIVPNPDPTLRTEERLLREIAGLRELLDRQIVCAGDVSEERFKAIDRQFTDLNDRTREQKEDTKNAVDAALQAAKEAVGKTETSTSDQLRQLSATFATEIGGIRIQLSDFKDQTLTQVAGLTDRVTGIEKTKVGGNEARVAMYALAGFIVSLLVIGGMVAAAGGFGS